SRAASSFRMVAELRPSAEAWATASLPTASPVPMYTWTRARRIAVLRSVRSGISCTSSSVLAVAPVECQPFRRSDPDFFPSRSTRGSLCASSRGVGQDRCELDEAQIREFLATQYPRLVGAVTLLCGSRALAEDAVQEAVARAWERSERGERIDALA